MKALVRYLRAVLLYRSGLLWYFYRRRAKGKILVLMFHRVLDDPEFYSSSSQPELLVRSSTFRTVLSWMSQRVEFVDLRKGVPRWGEQSSSKLRVAITFDDGWLDNFLCAVPVTAEANIPVTIFVCPGLLNRRFPFWPERVSYLLRNSKDKTIRSLPLDQVIEELKQLSPQQRDERIRHFEQSAEPWEFPRAAEPLNRTMDWEDIRQAQTFGVEIGSHTVAHSILTSVASECATSELFKSRQQIEAALDTPCYLLAYPNGNHNSEIRKTAAQVGYQASFTTNPGLWARETDLHQIPRINVFEQKLTAPNGAFSAAMASYYLFWRACRSQHGSDAGTVPQLTAPVVPV